ncbi:MAG: hypothetical protein AAGA28_13240 [Pseudomonadota bacterium]
MPRFTLLLLGLLCCAAIAANIPRALIHGTTPEARRSDVFSAFVTLSAEPGSEAIPFLTTWAEVTGQTARLHRQRLAHVHPALLTRYAEAAGLRPEALRTVLEDPDEVTPFDLSGAVFPVPAFDFDGVSGPWAWGVAQLAEDPRAPVLAGLAWCGIWIVFWTDADWYYAPIGTADLTGLLVDAVPELSEVPFDAMPGCTSDA